MDDFRWRYEFASIPEKRFVVNVKPEPFTEEDMAEFPEERETMERLNELMKEW